MSEKMIIEQCAPTLAGVKTASLFPCKYEDRRALLREIRAFNRSFAKKGLIMVPLKAENGFALIYVYRPKKLEEDFTRAEACELLFEKGYDAENNGARVARLVHRVQNEAAFPHEIGLFLGYPPEDVRGFMENRASNYKAVGCWKVYGDVNAAEKRFALYKNCTNRYKEEFQKGKSLSELAVAG